MKYWLLLIFCLLFFSCKKEDKEYTITITGTVNDQVTGHPVEGATVSVGYTSLAMQEEVGSANSVLTGPEGTYQLLAKAKPYITDKVSPGQYFDHNIVLFASKSGYIGSDRPKILYYGAHNSIINLLLYHSADLNLHVKNDTTNNIEAVTILLLRANSLNGLTLICYGRNLDSTYVVKNLYGNIEYSVSVSDRNGIPFNPPIWYRFFTRPDTINSFDISY